MASVKLTFDTNFEQASKGMIRGIKYTDAELKKLDKTIEKFDTKNLDEFVTKSKRLNAAVTLTKGPLQGLISQQRVLSRELEKGVKSGLDPMGEKLAGLRKEYRRVSGAIDTMRKAEKKAETARKAALATQRKQAALLKSIGASTVRYAKYALVGVTVAAIAMGVGFVKAAAGIEDAEAAFRPMLGSLEKAHYLVGMINKTAATTPFQFDALADSAKQLLPAVQGSMKGVIATIRMLGDTASGNAQRLDSVTRAYTKSLLRGRVDMRSMNMIAKAGVPIYTELAKTMGVTVAELFSMSRVGKITAKDLTAAFQQMTSEGGLFFNGMKIASETLTGRISTLNDNVLFLKANIGRELLPVVKNFVEVLLYTVKALREMTATSKGAMTLLTGLAAIFVTTGGALITFTTIVSAAIVGTEAFSAAIGGLWVVITAHPIGMLLTALALLVPALLFVAYNWEYVSKRFKIEADFMADVAKILGTQIANGIKSGFYSLMIDFKQWQLDAGKWLTGLAIKVDLFKQSLVYTDIAKAKYSVHIAKLTTDLVKYTKVVKGEMSKLKMYKKQADDNAVDGVTSVINGLLNSYKTRVNALAKLHKPKHGDNPGDIPMTTTPDPFSRILDNSVNDSEKRANMKQINDLKSYYTTRLKVERVGKGREKEFILSEMNRLLNIEKLHGQELVNVKTAANDLISELDKTSGDKRVKNQEKVLKTLKDKMAAFYSAMTRFELAKRKELRDKTASFYDAVALTDKRMLEDLLANVDEGVSEEIAVLEGLGQANDSITKRIIDSSSLRFKVYQDLVSQTTDKLLDFVHTGKMAWNDLLQTILDGMFKFKATKMFENLFSNMLFGGPIQPAMATVGISASDVLPGFATGGIITSPTIAHVGESGPEAVIPLVRKNGVLGLSGGGGGGNTYVSVVNQSSAKVETEESTLPNGDKEVRMFIVNTVRGAGDGGQLDGMMRRNFNVPRKGVKR